MEAHLTCADDGDVQKENHPGNTRCAKFALNDDGDDVDAARAPTDFECESDCRADAQTAGDCGKDLHVI